MIEHEKVDRYILAGSAIVVIAVVMVTSAKIKETATAAEMPPVEVAGD
jgi:hypothetical protein